MRKAYNKNGGVRKYSLLFFYKPTNNLMRKTTTKKDGFALPNEVVQIKYILKQKGNITNRRHVAYGGMLEGTLQEYAVRMDDDGVVSLNLTQEEKEYIINDLYLDEDAFNSYNEDSYFKKLKVDIGKEGIRLDLSKSVDFLKYKLLLSYTDVFSPDIFSTSSRKTYRYEVVRQKDVIEKSTKRLNYNKEAYKILGRIEGSKEALAGAYRALTSNRVSAESSIEWLAGKVGDLIDQDAKKFVETLSDEHYEAKLFIEKAIDAKAVKRSKGLYYTSEGVELAEEGMKPSLINAINFLNNISNQDIKLLISTKMK